MFSMNCMCIYMYRYIVVFPWTKQKICPKGSQIYCAHNRLTDNHMYEIMLHEVQLSRMVGFGFWIAFGVFLFKMYCIWSTVMHFTSDTFCLILIVSSRIFFEVGLIFCQKNILNQKCHIYTCMKPSERLYLHVQRYCSVLAWNTTIWLTAISKGFFSDFPHFRFDYNDDSLQKSWGNILFIPPWSFGVCVLLCDSEYRDFVQLIWFWYIALGKSPHPQITKGLVDSVHVTGISVWIKVTTNRARLSKVY